MTDQCTVQPARRRRRLRADRVRARPRITVRDLRRDEGSLLDDLVRRMSPHSRYLRFHAPLPGLTGAMRRALLDVDGHDHIAVVAEVDGDPVGIARMIRDADAPAEAEVAIAVVDAWHRRGVGRQLVDALARRARHAGVVRLHANVLAGNAAALGLLRSAFGLCLTRRDGDLVHLVCMLEQDWDITMDDILADLTS